MSSGPRTAVSLLDPTSCTAAARCMCAAAQLLHSNSKLIPPSHNPKRDPILPNLANEPLHVYIPLTFLLAIPAAMLAWPPHADQDQRCWLCLPASALLPPRQAVRAPVLPQERSKLVVGQKTS